GYFGSRQRERHLAAIQESYGFSDFLTEGYARFRLARWLYALCWSGDDHPGPLIERGISWLIANKVLLPGVTTLERFVGRIRDRARNRLWKRLVLGLNQDQRMRIAGLFDEAETSRFSELDALRTAPTKRRPTEFLAHLDRLNAIRAFNLRPVSPKGVPAATLERLARVARVGKPSAIAALQEPRRTATVAALFYTLEANAQDDAAELAEALLTDLIKDAEAADKIARLRSLRDLDAAALLLRDMGRLVFDEDDLPSINGVRLCSKGCLAPTWKPRWPKSTRSPGPTMSGPIKSFFGDGAEHESCSSISSRGSRQVSRQTQSRLMRPFAISKASPIGPTRRCAMRPPKPFQNPGARTFSTRMVALAIPRPMFSPSSTRGAWRSRGATSSSSQAFAMAIPGADFWTARLGKNPN